MLIGELGNDLSGGLFFMDPDDGPEATVGHPEEDTIVLAQLTVPTQTPFTMLIGEIQAELNVLEAAMKEKDGQQTGALIFNGTWSTSTRHRYGTGVWLHAKYLSQL